MAITLAQAVADLHTVSGSTITGSIGTVTAGNTLVVITFASGTSPVTLSSISIGPNTSFSQLIAAPGGSTTPAVEVWAMANIAAATSPSVTITFSAALSGGQDAIIMELSGMPSTITLDPATPLANSGGPTTSPSTSSINTAGSDDIIIVGIGPAGACTAAASPFSTNFIRTTGNSSGFSYEIVSSPQTGASCTFTTSNGLFGAVIVGLQGGSASAITPVLSGSMALSGVPSLELSYESDLTGVALLTGILNVTLQGGPVAPVLTGQMGMSGALKPSLAFGLSGGSMGLVGQINLSFGAPAGPLHGSMGLSGSLNPEFFSPSGPFLSGLMTLSGIVNVTLFSPSIPSPLPVGSNIGTSTSTGRFDTIINDLINRDINASVIEASTGNRYTLRAMLEAIQVGPRDPRYNPGLRFALVTFVVRQSEGIIGYIYWLQPGTTNKLLLYTVISTQQWQTIGNYWRPDWVNTERQ
jgi:hypothetical protein